MSKMIRPDASVLPESSLVPARGLVAPAPNQFTHRTEGAAEYWYEEAEPGGSPAGVLPGGTPVVLMRHDGGSTCWVVDGRGLYVMVAFAQLRKL